MKSVISWISAVTVTVLLAHSANVQAASLNSTNSTPTQISTSNAGLGPAVSGLRKFPYPYKAMLAVSSDADHETLRKFNLVHEFLNTTQQTPMGKGLGLDISDSMFMYNGDNFNVYTDVNQTPLSDAMSWFRFTSNQPYAMSILSYYIKAGWIDTLHTFGDFSMTNTDQTRFTSALAKQAIQSLQQNGDYLQVWTDHGNQSNVDDFGSYGTIPFYNYQQGANPWSPYYHTNMLIPYGVKFVWADGHSDVFGQSSMIYPLKLPDGKTVWGFNRYTDTGRTSTGIQWVWTVDDIPIELSQSHLNEIIQNHDYSIIATHFSANNSQLPFDAATIQSFQQLQKEQLDGNILVAGTSRLLNYNVVQQYLKYTVNRLPGKTIINITGVADPVFGWSVPTIQQLHGITFYTSNPQQVSIEIAGHTVPQSALQNNPSDGTAPSIGFTWYEPNNSNYTISSYLSKKSITLNSKTSNTPFGLVTDGTTYMPVWYVMQALNQMGIPNTWNGQDWSLTSTQATNLTNLSPGTGTANINVNGILVQKISSLNTTDPASDKPTTYMPIYDVMQVLKRIGATSTWNGSTWTITTG